MMKKLIDWVEYSNHYLHIGLLAALSLALLSIGAFESGAQALWANVWQTVKCGVLASVLIETYQAITSRAFDMSNTMGDLLADTIGLVLGVGAYLLLIWGSPITAIFLCGIAFLSAVFAFIIDEWKTPLILCFLGSLIVGFSLFIYA